MSAYAVAHLRHINRGPDIDAYLERIDATLQPFGGHFLVHGGRIRVLEGDWPGNLIIIEFENGDQAKAWYDSAAYQDILALRIRNSEGDVILADGVSIGHQAADLLTTDKHR